MSMQEDITERLLKSAVTIGVMRHVMKIKKINAEVADAVIEERVRQVTDARITWNEDLFNFVDPNDEYTPEKLKKKNPGEISDLIFDKASEGYEVGYVHGFTDAVRAFFSEI